MKNRTAQELFNRRKYVPLKALAIFIIIFMMITIPFSIIGDQTALQLTNGIGAVEHEKLEFGIDTNDGNLFIKRSENSNDFKILVMSDIHLCASIYSKSKDKLAISAIVKMVQQNVPDLIIITGDALYPSAIRSFSYNNEIQLQLLCNLMKAIDIPWGYVFGNHDAEQGARLNRYQIAEKLAQVNNCLFTVGPKDVSGTSNYIIKVLNPNNTLNTSLIMMDSNNKSAGGYEGIQKSQVEWYETKINELKNKYKTQVKSMIFTHIPLVEYKDAWEALSTYESDSQIVFGKNNERVNCQSENTGLFEKILELKSTTAVFCGHDHYNDSSIMYKGIRLTYSMAIDYAAYLNIRNKTAQRGGLVIKLSSNGSYEINQVKQDNNYIIKGE